MAEIALFHHIQGLTDGVAAFAEELRSSGHTVHVPDMFEGHTFGSIEEGFTYARETGFDTIRQRGPAALPESASGLVYAGISFGVTVAQNLAQTSADAAARFSSIRACRPPNSGPPGLPTYRYRSTARKTMSSSKKICHSHENLLTQRPRQNSSSTPATDTCSSTQHWKPMTRKRLRCSSSGSEPSSPTHERCGCTDKFASRPCHGQDGDMTKLLLTLQGPPRTVGAGADPIVASAPGPAALFSTSSPVSDSSHSTVAEAPQVEDFASALANRPLAYREPSGDWHEIGYEAADHWEGLSPELQDRLLADRTAQLSRAEYSATTNGASASMITSNWTYSGNPRTYRLAGELRELAEVLAHLSTN